MHAEHAHATACANCGEPLQGAFCHRCGQSAHDPVRSFGHAVEEVFESFWHLDGRIFRTLRALLAPGRLALDYLAGHRVAYVAPLRLFVVLSVLTFFVARLAVHVGPAGHDGSAPATSAAPRQDDALARQFAQATTAEQVNALHARSRADLDHALDELPDGLGKTAGKTSMKLAAAHVDQLAARRLKELGAVPATRSPATATTKATSPSSADDASPGLDADGKPVELNISGLPAFANAWLSTQATHAKANLPRLQDNPGLLAKAFLASVPSALFVLVPLFALLLRVLYLGSGRVYLEHLVVALYSHAFLCMGLLVVLLLSMLKGWAAPHVGFVGTALGGVEGLLLAWMPVYLLLMQKRVYGQGWPMTTVKYLVVGWVYAWLVGAAALWLMFASLSHL